MNINDLSPIKQRFYMVFKSTGLSQSEFGKVLGKSQNLISSILNNKRSISGDMIQLLWFKFRVNPEFILHGQRPMFIEKFDINRRIPIIADIPAGDWREWFDSYAAVAGDDYIAAPEVKGDNLFAIRVIGDSMEPLLFEGDILVIDPHKEFMHGLAVVRHNWEYKIRDVERRNAKIGYLHQRSERKYHLCPQNKKYPAEEITSGNETKIYVPVKVISLRDI